jgi:hypothetical protein
LTSSSWRAASHSSGVTIEGVFISLSTFQLMSLIQEVPQRAEPAVPVARQRGQELLRHLHRGGVQPVPHPAPLTRLGRYQAGLGQRPARSVAVAGPPAASAARMARRVGSARALNTCSAIASMSGGIEVVDQLA